MTESKRLSKLITSLLTLARSDADKEEMQFATVSINEVVEVAAAYFQSLEEVSGVSLAVECEPNLTVRADQERLHQLLVILLDNAVTYTPPGGKVTVSAKGSEKQIMITVKDTGVGIAANHLPHIFDRFYRVDQARTGGKGTGLGLAIAAWIAEKHDGKITVESEPGTGSSFIVVLPRKK